VSQPPVAVAQLWIVRHHYAMNTLPDLKKRVRRMVVIVRLFGWFFVPLAAIFILVGIFALLDPQMAVTINGVQRTDTTAKLFFIIFPVVPLGIGLFLILVPKSWIATVFVFHEDQMRRIISLFKKPKV
jgi:hypothetical protein